MTTNATYHAPTRPYSPIDSLNRMSAALGSPRRAMGASHADYNGHRITVRWNSYRRYYVAGYTWAGWRVIGRGSFATCLRAAMREHNRGALGSSVTITLREGDAEAAALAEATEGIVSGPQPAEADWYTWRHKAAARCARDTARPGAATLIFDWDLMQEAEDRSEYEAALKAKHGRVWR
jgi:hypothetical protein